MDEKHLRFYIGDITEGEIDGTVVENLNMACYGIDTNTGGFMALRFALRCDDGYEATNVKIFFKWYTRTGIYTKHADYRSPGYDRYIYTNDNDYYHSIGKVEAKNRIIDIDLESILNTLKKLDDPTYSNFKIEVSYDIAPIGVS